MGIQVSDSFNQLKIERGSKVEYYKYSTIKSISVVSDSNSDFSVVINFIANDKNNALILSLKDITNEPTWLNTAAGANVAIEAISDWMHTDNPSDEVTVTGWTGPLGQKAMTASIPVVVAQDQSDMDVVVKGPLGQEAKAASVPVTIASDQGNLDVDVKGPIGVKTKSQSLPVTIASDEGTQRTTSVSRVSNSSSVLAGAFSVSIANVHASANSTVKTVILKPGETISFNAGGIYDTLDAITYDATSSELLIITVT